MNAEGVSELIGHIYDAAVEPERWPAAFERLGEALGGAAFVMSALHRSKGMLFGVVTGQDPESTRILRTRYYLPGTNPLVAAMPGLPVGKLVARRTVHGDEAYFRGELYNEVFRPQALAHRAVACLHRTEEVVCPLGILQPRRQAEFSGDEWRVLETLIPHLRRGVKMTLRTIALQDAALVATGALDRVAAGIFVADGRGRIVHLNGAAERLVHEQDGLRLREGELAAWRHGESLALREAIAAALERPQDPACALLIHRPGGGRPYLATVAPLSARLAPRLCGSAVGAIVIVGDPSSRPAPRERLLRELFGLSAKEAQLAMALLDGQRLEEHASGRGISHNTAKSQLRAVFAKTRTSRQSELVRLLNAVPVLHDG